MCDKLIAEDGHLVADLGSDPVPLPANSSVGTVPEHKVLQAEGARIHLQPGDTRLSTSSLASRARHLEATKKAAAKMLAEVERRQAQEQSPRVPLFGPLASVTLGHEGLSHALEDLRIEWAEHVAITGDSAFTRWCYRLRGARCVVQHAWGLAWTRIRSATSTLLGRLRT